MKESTGDRPEALDGVSAESRTSSGGRPGLDDRDDRLHKVVRVFHNEVGSPLAAIGLLLEMLRGQLHPDQAADAELRELSRELDKVVDAVRRTLKELREVEAARPR